MKWYESVEGIKKRNETYRKKFLEKYGVENPQQLKEIQDKTKETSQNKYGGIGFTASYSDKCRKTTKKRFGTSNVMQSEIGKTFFRGDKNPLKKEEARKKLSESKKGVPSPLKGKSYEEILGEERAETRKIEQKKNGQLGWLAAPRISKPQLELFAKIKDRYPTAVLEFPVLDYCIDIAVPNLKLAFEYDGAYWHQDPEKDRQRDLVLEQLGWKVERFN